MSDFQEAEEDETTTINAISTDEPVAQESNKASSAPDAEESENESRGKVPKLTLADLPTVAPSLLSKPPNTTSGILFDSILFFLNHNFLTFGQRMIQSDLNCIRLRRGEC